LVIIELTFIGLARLDEIVLALTIELSVDKVALIHISVKGELALASFLSLCEVAVVLTLTGLPNLLSFSFLFIVDPLAVVQSAALLVVENTLAVSLSIEPLALVNVSISIVHAALSIHVLVLHLS